MAKKENKGGILTNEQVERDQKIRDTTKQPGGYRGMQDTGDEALRSDRIEADKQEDLQNGAPDEKS